MKQGIKGERRIKGRGSFWLGVQLDLLDLAQEQPFVEGAGLAGVLAALADLS